MQRLNGLNFTHVAAARFSPARLSVHREAGGRPTSLAGLTYPASFKRGLQPLGGTRTAALDSGRAMADGVQESRDSTKDQKLFDAMNIFYRSTMSK